MRIAPHPTLPARRRAESGSAYIMALLALLVISVLGLSIVYITQTEMEIGSNERSLERTFYAADSGLAIAAARLLVNNESPPVFIDVREPGAAINVRQQIDIAAAIPISVAACNLCEINNFGTYQGQAYRKINHALTVRANRVIGSRTTATKTVAAMLELQPINPGLERFLLVNDPVQLEKLRK